MSNVIQFRPRQEEPSHGDGDDGGSEVIEIIVKVESDDWYDEPKDPTPVKKESNKGFWLGAVLGFLLGVS